LYYSTVLYSIGNGTEEIVQALQPHLIHLPLPSSWAPQSKLVYKPWLNEQDTHDICFASIHLYDGPAFYPGSGQGSTTSTTTTPTNNNSTNNNSNIINIPLTPLKPGPNDNIQSKIKLSKNKREELHKIASQEFRCKIQQLLLPKLQSFQPNLLFLSAGFDAHIDDYYHYLSEEDIHWVTEQLIDCCRSSHNNNNNNNNNNSDGFIGVISILEGGYSLVPLFPDHSSHSNSNSQSNSSMTSGTGSGSGQKRRSTHNSGGSGSTSTVPLVGGGGAVVGGEVNNTLKYGQCVGDGGLVKR
jgi:hypothetical protein